MVVTLLYNSDSGTSFHSRVTIGRRGIERSLAVRSVLCPSCVRSSGLLCCFGTLAFSLVYIVIELLLWTNSLPHACQMLNEHGGNEFYSSKNQQLARTEHTVASSNTTTTVKLLKMHTVSSACLLSLYFSFRSQFCLLSRPRNLSCTMF
jgi:hypothetical protein